MTPSIPLPPSLASKALNRACQTSDEEDGKLVKLTSHCSGAAVRERDFDHDTLSETTESPRFHRS